MGAPVTIERIFPSGGYRVTELVTDDHGAEPWFESLRLFGYPKRECRRLFREHCREQGLHLV